jgi:hypothetical protein
MGRVVNTLRGKYWLIDLCHADAPLAPEKIYATVKAVSDRRTAFFDN